MIHKNKGTNHSPQPERKNAFYLHGFTDSGITGFNNDIKHINDLFLHIDIEGKISFSSSQQKNQECPPFGASVSLVPFMYKRPFN
jgi:hypothetical protein